MKKLKCAVEDYTEADFPATRKDVFFDSYKEHFSLIVRVGLLSLLFLIPIILISYMRDFYVMSTVEGLEEATKENIAAVYFTANIWYGSFLVIAETLFFVLFTGVLQIVRQLLWNEPVFFGDDFKNGLKSNAIRFGVVAFVLALIDYARQMLRSLWMNILVDGALFVLIIPVAVWVVLYGIYYKLGVIASIKNAVLLYFKTVPITLLLLLCTILPFWLVKTYVPLLVVKYLILVALAIFYIVPLAMCWMLYASHIFDKFINKEHYPEIYRKGMRKENKEES